MRTYRDLLRDELNRRLRNRGGYSLRAFARDMGVSAPRLSEILSGKKGLSSSAARKISAKLKLGSAEESWFLASVQSQHARSPVERRSAARTLESLAYTSNGGELSLERFELVANPVHFMVLELMKDARLENATVEEISRSSGLSLDECRNVVDRLIKVGVLARDDEGRWRPQETLSTPDLPSRAIREYHRMLMKRASDLLEVTSREKRDYSSIQFRFASELQMESAKKEIEDFRRAFVMKYASPKELPAEVYCISIQFFPGLVPEQV